MRFRLKDSGLNHCCGQPKVLTMEPVQAPVFYAASAAELCRNCLST